MLRSLSVNWIWRIPVVTVSVFRTSLSHFLCYRDSSNSWPVQGTCADADALPRSLGPSCHHSAPCKHSASVVHRGRRSPAWPSLPGPSHTLPALVPWQSSRSGGIHACTCSADGSWDTQGSVEIHHHDLRGGPSGWQAMLHPFPGRGLSIPSPLFHVFFFIKPPTAPSQSSLSLITSLPFPLRKLVSKEFPPVALITVTLPQHLYCRGCLFSYHP